MAMNRSPVRTLLAACLLAAALLQPAAAAEAVFPLASRIGLVPPDGLKSSGSFPGFGDEQNDVYVRLIALPAEAFAEIEKTMTDDALKKQGMTVEKRESLTLPAGKALLVIARQDANAVRMRKWLLIAPLDDITALVSFEVPSQAETHYPPAAIRASLATVVARATVPAEEQLQLLPFRMTELAGFRLVRVVPGVAVQFTDGPKDSLEPDQAHLVISVAPGGPQQAGDRDHFARMALSGLPPFKELRITNSEPLRISGQHGHEVRAEGKDPQTGTDIQIVQWIRFGTGAYMRIVGFAPKQNWTPMFMRFRTVRDGLEPR
jgi:hypothetical protein